MIASVPLPTMPDDNPKRTSGVSPTDVPNQSQVERARELAIGVFDDICGLAWHAGVMVDARQRAVTDAAYAEHYPTALQVWWDTARANLDKMDLRLAECERIVRPFGFFYDRVSGGVLSIGTRTYPNAHVAAHGVLNGVLVRLQHVREALAPAGVENLARAEQVEHVERCAVDVIEGVVSVVGDNFQRDYTTWVSLIRLEAAKALSALPPPSPTLSTTEQMIVDALKSAGKPLTQEKLLEAARLGITGTNKGILAGMRERGVLTNKGKGYGLPEWAT